MKLCFVCGRKLALASFYRHPFMADGRLNKCKPCTRADVRRNRAKRLAYYQAYDRARFREPGRRQYTYEQAAKHRRKYPDKTSARNAVYNAIRSGRLVRRPCEVCGVARAEAHHDDYSKPLAVRWLCLKHHHQHHQQAKATP